MTPRPTEYEWANLTDRMLVRTYPRGGLKLVRFPGLATWTSILPGVLGITGLLSNKLLFRGRWVVQLRSIGDTEVARFVAGGRNRAGLLVREAKEWLSGHDSVEGFVPRNGRPL